MCNSDPIKNSSKHLYLDLDKIQPKVEEWYTSAIKKNSWTNNGVMTTNTFLKDGLIRRCITRDIKWGVPVPLPGYESKVFYVWFDAPIGYLSITGGITEDWEKWWKNPDNVELYQFIGKDNILFHSLMFPCSLIGTGDKYTLVHHLSSTEFLNYEGTKFSKTK
jgi:methionyl-tRNA synthetase